jgi:excisionase family DNA binding protein
MATYPPGDAILLTVRDVARRLQVHEVTVRRHILAGRLKAVHVGKSVRVTPKDLEEYLHTPETDAQPNATSRPRPVGVAEPTTAYAERRASKPSRRTRASGSKQAVNDSESLATFEWPEPNYALLEANFARIDSAMAARSKTRRRTTPRPLTMHDGIWNIIGMVSMPELADLSENKHKYLAEVYGEDNK